MKKIILIIAALVLVASCGPAPLSERIDKCTEKVEQESKTWTEEDWEISQDEYELLIEEYTENYDSYTQEEKDEINKAIGRYTGLLLKQGIQTATDAIDDLTSRIPSFLEGFMGAFEEDQE